MNFFRSEDTRKLFVRLLVMTVVLTTMAAVINVYCGFMVLLTSVIFSYIFLDEIRSRQNKIAILTEKVDDILHDKDQVLFENLQEGELAVLESEIKKMTFKLREGAELLEKEKIYLSDSLADIAHQLRTPLTTINMQVSFLRKDITKMEKMKYISEINTHLERIEWLITSLLKISKIDAGTAVFTKEKILVESAIEEAVAPLLILFELKNQLLDYEYLGSEKMYGDKNWVAEAILNIIKNCNEHTQEDGHIKISASENAIYTQVIIEDNGPGVKKEDLPHLFERFYRGSSRKSSSVGIGLALTKMIITQHNGTIKVENKKEGGARFIIRFYKEALNGIT